MRALLPVVAGLCLLVGACASTSTDEAPVPSSDSTLPPPSADPAAPPAGTPPATPPGTPPAAPDCSIAALPATPDVEAAFLPGNLTPPAMTGGALDGSYVVHKATVYLPSGSSGLVDATKSTGKVSSWAIFKGPRYRLMLKADFQIVSVIGNQAQSVDTASQGAYTAAGPVLTLDHACDGAITDEADYSFTDNGSGSATLLIKTPTPYGDTYLLLEAQKNP